MSAQIMSLGSRLPITVLVCENYPFGQNVYFILRNHWCSSDYNIFVVRFGSGANELLINMAVSWIFI